MVFTCVVQCACTTPPGAVRRVPALAGGLAYPLLRWQRFLPADASVRFAHIEEASRLNAAGAIIGSKDTPGAPPTTPAPSASDPGCKTFGISYGPRPRTRASSLRMEDAMVKTRICSRTTWALFALGLLGPSATAENLPEPSAEGSRSDQRPLRVLFSAGPLFDESPGVQMSAALTVRVGTHTSGFVAIDDNRYKSRAVCNTALGGGGSCYRDEGLTSVTTQFGFRFALLRTPPSLRTSRWPMP